MVILDIMMQAPSTNRHYTMILILNIVTPNLYRVDHANPINLIWAPPLQTLAFSKRF